MKHCIVKLTYVILLLRGATLHAQNPLQNSFDALEMRYSTRQAIVNYTLSIDSKDLSSYAVEMRVRNVPDTFRIAMVTHPEYDDRFWRYLTELTVENNSGNRGAVIRKDSAVWRIQTSGGDAVIHYKIHLPKPRREQR